MSDEPGHEDLEALRAFWREAGRRLVEGNLPAIEVTAQHIITALGVLTGLYTGALGLGELGKSAASMAEVRLLLYLAPVGLWLVALVAALMVFWRRHYHLDLLDVEAIQEQVQEIAARKSHYLRIAMVFLVLGTGTLLLVLWDWLGRL